MNEVRVGVRVSGDDGARMVRSLEAAGLVVTPLDESGGGRARVVVVEVASSAEVGAVLRAFRTTSEGAPPTVILVGPEGAGARGFAAADAFFARPVPIAELVRVVRRFLAADRASRTFAQSTTASEATVRMDAPGAGRRSSSAPPGGSGDVLASRERQKSPASGGATRFGTSPGERARASSRARLSPALEQRLLDADRRLFPEATALPLDMPGAEARPAELVPDELLASPMPFSRESPPHGVFVNGAGVSRDEGEPDETEPRDGAHVAVAARSEEAEHTFSPEPLAPTALLDRRDSRRLPRAEALQEGGAPPRTEPEAPARDPLRAPAALRSGAAILLAIVDRAAPHRITYRDAEGRSTSVVLAGGAVVRFEGPVEADAVRRLHAEGRITELPPHRAEAAYFEASLADGLLRRVDVERCRREAIEASIAAFALGRAEEVSVDESERDGPATPLTRDVRAIVLDALRAHRASPLGDGEAFALRSGASAAISALGLLPEEVGELESLAGVAAAELRATAHGIRGLGGVLALLFELDLAYADVPSGAPSRPASAAALRVYLANAAARAVDGSYFDILGLAPGADGPAVARAHVRLSDELAALDLGAVGLHGLEEARARALEAVDEAYATLRSERLRRAYATALAAPEGGR